VELGVNTPEQLLILEEKTRARVRGAQAVVRARGYGAALTSRVFKPAAEWEQAIARFSPRARRSLAEIYGPDRLALEARRRDLLRPLRRFCRVFGRQRKVVIARAPAVVNLMGRHVDVVGGFINVTNVDSEAVMVASPREDDLVRLAPSSGRSGAREAFAIGREIAALGWEDWLTYLSSARVRAMIARARGDWSHIARAAAVRLQQHFKTRRLRGMDAVVQSGIPLASGLGASSGMLVAASDAFVALNGLEITPHQFVLLCGEGEWYLGARGTAASHAGVKLGRRGQVAHLRFFPFEADRLVPFPEGYRLVLCHAPASEGLHRAGAARTRALAAMEVALLLLRDRYPHLAHLMERVRDLNPRRLGISLRQLYGMLLDIPRRGVPSALRRLLSAEGRERLDGILDRAGSLPALRLRDALCFGMAECARSDIMAGVLERGDMARAAALLRASHDAERVARGREGTPWCWRATDAHLRRCIGDLESENPERVLRAQLARQPGRFGPGAKEIDRIVDVAQEVPGVVGAQLSGAGAGGCAMALVREQAVGRLKRALSEKIFRPARLRPAIDVCGFVEGAGLLAL